jgi:hypothetical protein
MAPYRLTQTQLIEIPKIWKNLATEFNGKFKLIHSKAPSAIAGAFNESTRFELHIPIDLLSNISITAGEQHNLKVKCLLIKNLNFNIRIVPEDIFEKIGKLFGGQDLKIGNYKFDSKYIIQSDKLILAKSLFDDKTIDSFFELNINDFEIRSENKTELFIMPLIREENEIKMKKLISMTGYWINKLYKL